MRGGQIFTVIEIEQDKEKIPKLKNEREKEFLFGCSDAQSQQVMRILVLVLVERKLNLKVCKKHNREPNQGHKFHNATL